MDPTKEQHHINLKLDIFTGLFVFLSQNCIYEMYVCSYNNTSRIYDNREGLKHIAVKHLVL
jgi:hypothetical protein